MTILGRIGLLARLTAAGALVAGGAAVLAASPASAGNAGGSTAGCSGDTCTIGVTFSGPAAPAPGSPAAAAYVQPDCWYEAQGNPKEFLKQYEDATAGSHYSGKSVFAMWGPFSAIEEAAKDPKRADFVWYMMSCREGIDIVNDKVAHDYAGQTVGLDGIRATLITLLLPPSQTPPPPPVNVESLRDAARAAMTIPDPTVEHSPTIAEFGGATLVNLPTRFTAGPDQPDSLWIKASAGTNSATVTAAEPSWTLSSPNGVANCTQEQMTMTLTAASTDACALQFTRTSNAMPVDFTSTWQTSWSGEPTPAGPLPLDTISSTSGITLPVRQSQSLVIPTN